MTISYKWLSKYLPEEIAPEQLSEILTSIGLEVESFEKFESVKGGLEGLIVGEVITCKQHPNADKLKLTEVNVGEEKLLQVVCGAPNVEAGQKVIVARIGTTIYPMNAQPVTMKKAVIRGTESEGMLCAEDEIGLSANHAGIVILDNSAITGSAVADYFNVYTDWIYEIGLTPNRTDAMSHIGVAKDVCAWLSFHKGKEVKPVLPFKDELQKSNDIPVSVEIENSEACSRYAGIVIKNIQVVESPVWLQNHLKAIGQRSINNIVDITNFILHETGQPLHAFDLAAVQGNQIIVKTLPEGTSFITLDGVERKLSANDLMICNAEEPMCIAGVFGGIKSGVANQTKDVFIESAWFNPVYIRKTSLHHNLRTEAATHFEKGVDISNAVEVLKRAASLIIEIAGGEIASSVADVFPNPPAKKEVVLQFSYLKKLSGKEYSLQQIKTILTALDFEVLEESDSFFRLAVPFNKYDVSLPADVVEEIIRIDGLNNIEIPSSFSITPSVENTSKEALKERIAGILTGLGFNEIITNSITNSKYYNEKVLESTIHMLNSLSNDLDIMKPSTLETGLESISYNVNRKQTNLSFFEFGATYKQQDGKYIETPQLTLWITGNELEKSWNQQEKPQTYYRLKGIIDSLLKNFKLNANFTEGENTQQGLITNTVVNKKVIGSLIEVNRSHLSTFDINQKVFFVQLNLQEINSQIEKSIIRYAEISKYPLVERDLSLVINKSISYQQVSNAISEVKIPELVHYKLFDVYENEKLGVNNQSFSMHFEFMSPAKTLTDNEIDSMMNKIILKLENDLQAIIRTK